MTVFMCVRNAGTPWTGIIRRHLTLKRKLSVSLQRNIPQERNADGNPSPWKALWRNSGNGLYYMRNYIQTDTVRISAIYLRTGGTPEIAHYATEWMVTVIPFITSSGEVGKKRGFTSKLGYLYPSSSHLHEKIICHFFGKCFHIFQTNLIQEVLFSHF